MNMANRSRDNQQRKPGRFSGLFQEWVFQLVLFVAIVGAIVERGAAMGNGMFV
jgi:hypothetical protein